VLDCSPSSLSSGPAQILTVSGTGFNAADADVSIPGLSSATVQSRTTTSLTVKVTVPVPATGLKDVTVTSALDGLTGTKFGCFNIA
jgi:hypothetical protein